MVKLSKKMKNLSNFVAVPHQTWIIGSSLSDLLIASAMLYHVSTHQLLTVCCHDIIESSLSYI